MGVPLSGLTKAEATTLLNSQLPLPAERTILLVGVQTEVASTSTQLGLHYQLDAALEQAWQVGRQGPPLQRAWQVTELAWKAVDVQPILAFESNQVASMVAVLAAQDDTEGQEPQVTLTTSGQPASLKIEKGHSGHRISAEPTKQLLAEAALSGIDTIMAASETTVTALNDEQAAAALKRAQAFVGHQAVWKGADVTLRVSDQELISLLHWPTGVSENRLTTLLESWAERVARPPQDAEFSYDPATLQVTTFIPPKDGLSLDWTQTRNQIEDLITQIDDNQRPKPDALNPATPFELMVTATAPTKTLASTNDLGINERIGFGESEYFHSIPSRIHNVALAARNINNYVVKPGEEFSFNQALGDVSSATGYQPAYVIKSGQTVLGDGGGVCQVSTTLFRALLSAGLPITKRRPHSYRVSYYELDSKPGIDATVYAGDVDLRFINDTNHYVLIHTETDSKNLYMKIELYGTSDGRTTEISEHKTWDYRPAPPAVYIPDASLPHGKLKQVDWAASGIKASFRHIVKDKDGNVLRDQVYSSNYVPWSAKFLQGI